MASEPDLGGRDEQLKLVAEELDREIAYHVQRANAMEQRATILIGTAGIIGALQLSGGPIWANNVNLILSLLAAVAGVVVVFPRRGDALDLRPIRDQVLGMDAADARYKLTDTKLEILEADEKWLGIRGLITRIGFIFLALSIVIALFGSVSERWVDDPPSAPMPAESGAGHGG